jgi:hypothetical protein
MAMILTINLVLYHLIHVLGVSNHTCCVGIQNKFQMKVTREAWMKAISKLK